MDEERAEYLVSRYADLLVRIGYTWLGDMDDAQDICQTVLLRLLEDTRTFPDSGQERAWVIRLAVNACKNWKKTAWFRHRAPLEDGLQLTVQMPDLEEGSLLEQVQRLPPMVPAGHLPAVLRGVRSKGDRTAAGAVTGAGEYPLKTGKGKTENHVGRYGVCTIMSIDRSWTGSG